MKDRIVLFCGDHYGSLSQFICLSEPYRKTHRVILLISVGSDSQKEHLYSMQRENLFEIMFFDYRIMSQENDLVGIMSGLDAYLSQLFFNQHIDLNYVDDVFVSNSGYFCSFELFLCYRMIKYSIIEFAENDFYSMKLLNSFKIYSSISSEYKKLVQLYGCIIGDNINCITHIYLTTSIINESLSNNIVYNFYNGIISLPYVTKQKLFKVFPCLNKISKIDCLLLPNSESYTKKGLKESKVLFNDTIAAYTLLLDTLPNFNESTAYIKPHPYGYIPFDKYFPYLKVIDKDLPIELILLKESINVDTAISIDTNAAYRIRGIVSNSVVMGRYYYTDLKTVVLFKYLHFLSAANKSRVYLNCKHSLDVVSIFKKIIIDDNMIEAYNGECISNSEMILSLHNIENKFLDRLELSVKLTPISDDSPFESMRGSIRLYHLPGAVPHSFEYSHSYINSKFKLIIEKM